jgi:hypothetical protein
MPGGAVADRFISSADNLITGGEKFQKGMDN